MLFSGIEFCIGAIIDEAHGHHQLNNYVSRSTHSRGRVMVVGVWILFGFIMTISFKSVLRARMMTVEYEKTIDTLDDALSSGLSAVMPVDTSLKKLLQSDPREKVQQLAKNLNGYILGNGTFPEWVTEGYVFITLQPTTLEDLQINILPQGYGIQTFCN